MKRALAVLLMLPSIAIAQTTPAPAPGPLPEYTLKVTSDELNIISEGLQGQPFGKVLPLINKLREQIVAQQPKQEEPKK